MTRARISAEPLPKYVYRQTVKGRTYYRFRRPGLAAIRLPNDPSTPEFAARYEVLLNGPASLLGPPPAKRAIVRYCIEEALRRAQRRAVGQQLPFDLTPEHINELMAAQRYACAVSGIAFDLGRSDNASRAVRLPFRPSIDRVVPAKGYVRTNVRILCFAVNMAISDWGDAVFREICEATVRTPNQPQRTPTIPNRTAKLAQSRECGHYSQMRRV